MLDLQFWIAQVKYWGQTLLRCTRILDFTVFTPLINTYYSIGYGLELKYFLIAQVLGDVHGAGHQNLKFRTDPQDQRVWKFCLGDKEALRLLGPWQTNTALIALLNLPIIHWPQSKIWHRNKISMFWIKYMQNSRSLLTAGPTKRASWSAHVPINQHSHSGVWIAMPPVSKAWKQSLT